EIADVFRDVFDVESLTLRLTAATQIECVHGEPLTHELLGHPRVLPTMRVEAMTDHHHRTRRGIRTPDTVEDLQSTHTFVALFDDGDSGCLAHRAPCSSEIVRVKRVGSVPGIRSSSIEELQRFDVVILLCVMTNGARRAA